MAIDLEGPDPLYQQAAAILRERIADGTYPPNRRIPSETALSDEFDVSRPTIRKALDVLRAEGLIRGVKGRGTFVTQQDAPPAE